MVFTCISMMTNNIVHFFVVLLASCMFFGEVSDLLPVFIVLAFKKLLGFRDFLNIYSTYKFFIGNMHCQCYLQVCGLLFHFLNDSFNKHILFCCLDLIFSDFIISDLCALPKKSLSMESHRDIILLF